MSNEKEDKEPVQKWPCVVQRISNAKLTIEATGHGLKEEESKACKRGTQSAISVFAINGYATILIFIFHLISLESLFSILLSIVFTVFTYFQAENNINWNGGIMDWILLSFAIVTPMASSISMAFSRRDRALAHIVAIRSFLVGIYQAHATWDWGSAPVTGRQKSNVDWLAHSDSVLAETIGIADEICRYLSLPQHGRARHRVTSYGKDVAEELGEVGNKLIESVFGRMSQISLHCEVMKLEGLPGNEAARIRQWERAIINEIEGLQVIKEYRTPQALRSLCRIFSVLLPPFYAPYYAQLARDLNSLGTAIAFSVLTSLVLTALFESLTQLEDPFVAHLTLDGIDVPKELRHTIRDRLLHQRNNVHFRDVNKPFEAVVSDRRPDRDNLSPLKEKSLLFTEI